MGRLRVLVYSSNAAVLAGLRATLSDKKDMTQVRVAAPVREFSDLSGCITATRPDILVFHYSGEALSLMPIKQVPAMLVAFDSHIDGADILRVVRMGATSAISVTDDLSGLPTACREVAGGSAYLSPSLARTLVSHIARGSASACARFDLTAREAQVLRHLTVGRSSLETARSMGVEQRTVKHHLSNIYRKLGVRDATQAAVFAYREGLVA